MGYKVTRRGSITTVALAGALAAVAIGNVTSAAAAAPVAPPSGSAGEYHPSAWVKASDFGDRGNASSLTTSREQLGNGTGFQLWLGYVLVGAGLLALTLAFALRAGRASPAPLGPSAHATTWARRHVPGRTHARS